MAYSSQALGRNASVTWPCCASSWSHPPSQGNGSSDTGAAGSGPGPRRSSFRDHAVHWVIRCLSCQPSYSEVEPPDPDSTLDGIRETCQHLASLEVSLAWESEGGVLGTISPHCGTLATVSSTHRVFCSPLPDLPSRVAWHTSALPAPPLPSSEETTSPP